MISTALGSLTRDPLEEIACLPDAQHKFGHWIRIVMSLPDPEDLFALDYEVFLFQRRILAVLWLTCLVNH